MAKQTLPTNFKDDILNSSMGGKRRYKQTTNADGTVSLEDASTYDQVGSNFGASQLNAISKAVNQSADSSKIISDPDTASATTQKGYIADVQLFNHLTDSLTNVRTYVGSDGKLHFVDASGADSVLPFKSGAEMYYSKHTSVKTITIETTRKAKFIAIYAEVYAYGYIYSDGSYTEPLELPFNSGTLTVNDNSFTYNQTSGANLTYHVIYVL